jgi:hypothetical protein
MLAVIRQFQEQALSVAYGVSLTIPVGAIDPTVTLDDSAIGFWVQDQATGTPEEAIPAGGSWACGNQYHPLGSTVVIQVRSVSGTPNATVVYFTRLDPT